MYLYNRGACSFAGGIEYASVGLTVGTGWGGPVQRGFCGCGWSTYWEPCSSWGYESLAKVVKEHAQAYGALAYSPSTRKSNAAWRYSYLEQAKRDALKGCVSPDAQLLTWGFDCYIALATSSSGVYGYEWGSNENVVVTEALKFCRASDPNCQIQVLFHTSFGIVQQL